MQRFRSFILLSVLVLPLTGCGIPGGIAQLVKTANKRTPQQPVEVVEEPSRPTAAPSVQPEPPPPAASAARESIKVESLPPPSR